jgi:hypothetical protein
MGEMKKVALLIETSTSYGRALVKGILQYANFATSWIFYLVLALWLQVFEHRS